MCTWRIYYGDGSEVSELDPYEVPGLNVQVIVQADEDVGRYVLHGHDFYWWMPDESQWFGGDVFGLWDYLAQPGPRKVIFARSLSNVEYKRILNRALTDPNFAPKTASLPGERT